ncbi:hypothetical protein [Streptomyces sp. CAU 1734]|uniref:hypothetical protein n=1 Tax=Streptomyces sp. CAU 1734 TaxID=3140360 RepID=UPI003260283F
MHGTDTALIITRRGDGEIHTVDAAGPALASALAVFTPPCRRNGAAISSDGVADLPPSADESL